jgi:hypothetical protein
MIHGIVSSSFAVEPPPGVGLYDGASVVMDFENAVYLVNGVAADVADLIDNVTTIDGTGLVLDWNVEPYVPEIAMLSTLTDAIDFAAGWSVLIDLVQYDLSSTTGSGGTIVHFWNGTYSIPGRHEFQIDTKQSTVEGYDMRLETVGSSDRLFSISTALGEGVRRKMVVTRAGDRLAACLNAGAVTQDTTGTAGTPIFTTFTLGGNPGDGFLSLNCVVKKVIFYPLISNALLPSYTA